ncbi:MAG: DUF1194 domain-containing protein [Rhodovibrionaceae bacterium]
MRRSPRPILTKTLACLGLCLWLTPPVLAQGRQVDLELVIAVDCSYSVDLGEFELQAGGIGQAFRTQEVVDAILQGAHGAIAVTVLQWSSQLSQEVAIPWTVVDSRQSAVALSLAIESMPRLTADGATSISAAVAASLRLFERSPVRALRRVIDVSGDGRNNNGPALRAARDTAVGRGITINGLAILNEVPTLHKYFELQLIGGTGAFVEIANRYSDYPEAMARKLVKEITYFPVSRHRPEEPLESRFAAAQPPVRMTPDSGVSSEGAVFSR